MPVTIEEFNKFSGTNFTQESFNRGFLTIMSNVPKEHYNDTFTKLYLNALKTAINSHIESQKNIDILKCMRSFDDMFKTSIDNYNEYAKNIDNALSLNESNTKTIKYLENGGVDKSQIKNYVDGVIKSGPLTEQSKYKEKIKVSSYEDIAWGTKDQSKIDETTKLNNAAMRQVNVIFDGQPTVIMFEGKPNELEVPINLNYIGKAPQTVNFGNSSKAINYKESDLSAEDKLHHSIQVVKAMEELHNEHDKSFSIQHPIKNANELKGINDLKNTIMSKGYSKTEFDNEYLKESPMQSFILDYESKVNEYIKTKEDKIKAKQMDLIKNLEKETLPDFNKSEKAKEKGQEITKTFDDPTNNK